MATADAGQRSVLLSAVATSAIRWSALIAVAVVPLLVDLASVDDTYYGLKARALWLLGGVIVAGWGVRAIRGGARLTLPDFLPLGAFAAAAALATLTSVRPSWAILGSPYRHEGLLVLLAYAAIAAASIEVGREWSGRWLTALIGGATFVGVYGIAQYFGFELFVRDPIRRSWTVAFATTGHPNYYGTYMVLVFPFALTAWLGTRATRSSVAALLATLVLYAGILFSYSRAAWAGGMFAAGLWAAAVLLRRSEAVRFRAVIAGVVLLIITLVFLIPNGPLAARDQASPAREARTALDLSGPRVADRVYLWRHGMTLLARRPLLGYGPDNLALVFPQQWDETRARFWGPVPRTIDRAHNEFLDLGLSVGVVGLLAYGWVVAAALGSAVRALRGPLDVQLRGGAALAGLLGYLLALQFGFSVVGVAPVFWSVLGMAIGLSPRGTGHR
jgi:putative inorganic carbon (HCO3(-)) transporter